MGVLQRIGSLLGVRPNAGEGADATGGGFVNGAGGVRSPWGEGALTSIVWNDVLEGPLLAPVTRAEAMGVPAIAKGRHMIVNDASRCPLEVVDAGGAVASTAGSWLQSTRLRVSPQHRMVWTVDDLMFYGWSLWIVQREDPADLSSEILDGARCPREWWRFGPAGEVLVKQGPTFETVAESVVLLIPGFTEGILKDNPRTIRGARELEAQWANRAANPIPAVELHQTTPDQMTETEVRALVKDWSAALAANGGAVAYTPSSIEARIHGTAQSDLLIEGRNAASVDSARIVGMPAAMLDATNATASLTYETTQGRNLEYVDRTLSLWLGPIEARFSLDDVTPPGTSVRARTSAITSGPAISAAITKD